MAVDFAAVVRVLGSPGSVTCCQCSPYWQPSHRPRCCCWGWRLVGTVGAAVLRNRWSSPLERQHSWALHTHRQDSRAVNTALGGWAMSVCVCVHVGGGGGENVSHAVHAALGGWVMCGGGGRSRGSHAINTHTAQKQWHPTQWDSLSLSLSKVGILFLPVL